jgi:UDPglucose 6-dehydrogenase
MNEKRMNIGFVGLGKLGFDSATALGEKHNVTGYDINRTNKTSNFKEVDNLEEACKGQEVVLVAVQTPHDPIYGGEEPTSHLEPKDFDYTFIKQAVADIDELVDPGTLIAVISTMLPGTVRSQIAPLVKNGKFIYNPYLIAQGTVIEDMKNPEMIMIGTEDGKVDENVEKLFDVYDPILKDVYNTRYEVGTWEETEATKVFYNTFISAKLTLVNMIQDVAMKVGHMNVDQVANSLAKSYHRITSNRYMKPGFGDGGGCHPRDNIALRVLNQKYNLGYDLFDAIMKAREEQAHNMARWLCDQAPHDVVILGKAFKPGLKPEDGHTVGSPSMLVGWYVEKTESRKVYYDKAPDDKPYIYLIHDNQLYPEVWNPGSVIVDVNRELSDNIPDCKVLWYGVS